MYIYIYIYIYKKGSMRGYISFFLLFSEYTYWGDRMYEFAVSGPEAKVRHPGIEPGTAWFRAGGPSVGLVMR